MADQCRLKKMKRIQSYALVRMFDTASHTESGARVPGSPKGTVRRAQECVSGTTSGKGHAKPKDTPISKKACQMTKRTTLNTKHHRNTSDESDITCPEGVCQTFVRVCRDVPVAFGVQTPSTAHGFWYAFCCAARLNTCSQRRWWCNW